MFQQSANHIASQCGKKLKDWAETRQEVLRSYPSISNKQLTKARQVWARETQTETEARRDNDE